jgi:hypothetical protein
MNAPNQPVQQHPTQDARTICSTLTEKFWSASAAWGVIAFGSLIVIAGTCAPLAPGAAGIQQQLLWLFIFGLCVVGFGILMLGFTYAFERLKIQLPGVSMAEAAAAAAGYAHCDSASQVDNDVAQVQNTDIVWYFCITRGCCCCWTGLCAS